jgi:hypothetical protein
VGDDRHALRKGRKPIINNMIAVAAGQDYGRDRLVGELANSSTTPLPAGKVVFASTTMTPFWPTMMPELAPPCTT